MTKPNPINARAGNERRFSVSPPMRKGFLRYSATLTDRLDPGWNGLRFTGITAERAMMKAWRHADRIVSREVRIYGGYATT